MYKLFYKLHFPAWMLPRLKLGFLLGWLGIFVGIVAFLIIVAISHSIYVAVRPGTLFVFAVGINNIDSHGRDKVVLRPLSLFVQILAAVMSIFLALFAGFTICFINRKVKSSQPYFFLSPRSKFLGFRIFFWLSFNHSNIYWLAALVTMLVNVATSGG